MQKNVASQKWIVFAFDETDNTPKTGDAANITANIRLDGGAANGVDDTNPTELEDGYYVFDISQAESNADLLSLHPASSTGDIQVIGVPGAVWTRPAAFNTFVLGDAAGVASGLHSTTNGKVDAVQTDIGDFSGRTNDQSLLDVLGVPDVADKDLHTLLVTDRLDEGTFGLAALQTLLAAIPTTAMRGTDNAALATVLGALADAAADGDPTTTDTLMKYIKQLINILIGSAGIPAFPAEAAPANDVSLVEVIRAIHADVTGLDGDVMRGTNSANTTTPPTVGEIQTEMEENGASILDSISDLLPGSTIAAATDIPAMRGTDGAATAAKLLAYFQLLVRKDVAIASDNSAELTELNTDEGSGVGTFDNQTDSPEALRDRGDAAWTTGGGGSITDILNVHSLIPNAIDLANTATVRLALALTNGLDDLPSTVEITPGTISIDRKAIGGTSWANIVNAAACSEAAGMVYYDEVFDAGTTYAANDSIRITFAGQKITVDGNDYEITGAGWIFYTYIRSVAGAGAGAITWTYTLTDSAPPNNPIADADVWVTSDIGGNNVIASGITDQNGVVTFYLDAGTVYVWSQKSGWDFLNPDTEVVS